MELLRSIRSSHRRCSVRKRPAALLKKRLWHKCFSVNFANKNNFFIEDPWATASEASGEEIDLKERKSTVSNTYQEICLLFQND